MLWEVVLAILAGLGLAACVGYLAGRLCYPVRGAVILLPAWGDAGGLEYQMKGLAALSREGRIAGETILLADLGLNPEGLERARLLCRRYPELVFCPGAGSCTQKEN